MKLKLDSFTHSVVHGSPAHRTHPREKAAAKRAVCVLSRAMRVRSNLTEEITLRVRSCPCSGDVANEAMLEDAATANSDLGFDTGSQCGFSIYGKPD